MAEEERDVNAPMSEGTEILGNACAMSTCLRVIFAPSGAQRCDSVGMNAQEELVADVDTLGWYPHDRGEWFPRSPCLPPVTEP